MDDYNNIEQACIIYDTQPSFYVKDNQNNFLPTSTRNKRIKNVQFVNRF